MAVVQGGSTTRSGKGWVIVADTVLFIDDLTAVHVGHRLEAWSSGVLLHAGIVEETLPELGVVWIREIGTGQRKMLDVIDYDLRLR